MAARRAVYFKKTWNPEFDFLFKAEKEDIEICYRKIYKFYMASFPGKAEKSKKSQKENSDGIKQRKQSTHSSRPIITSVKQRSNSIKTTTLVSKYLILIISFTSLT